MAGRTYIETFDDGPGGWVGWDGNSAEGTLALEIKDEALVARSPWWVDYNHAPPGGGYLHLLYCLLTTCEGYAQCRTRGGVNRFVEGGYPLNWTNAQITVRLKGEVELRGTDLYLLAQAKVRDKYINAVLSDQPLAITPDWSEQTITLVPDEDRWQCMGSHVSRMDRYGWGEAADILKDLNGDIIFVLFPLDVVPAEPVEGNPHHLRAGEDYAVDRSRLPEGYVMMGSIKIAFAET